MSITIHSRAYPNVDFSTYDPKTLFECMNVPWEAIKTIEAKAITASRDLFDQWKKQFIASASEYEWQSVGPTVDDSLPAGTIVIDMPKVELKSAQVTPPPPNVEVPPGSKLMFDSKTNSWKVVPETTGQDTKPVKTAESIIFERVEDGADFDEVKEELKDLPDAETKYAIVKEFYDNLAAWIYPRIVEAVEAPADFSSALSQAGLDIKSEASTYAAMSALRQVAESGIKGLPLTREVAQQPASVMMLEHLANQGLVKKDLRRPEEVVPGARVPVYILDDKGEKLLNMYQGAQEYRQDLGTRLKDFYGLQKYAPGAPKEQKKPSAFQTMLDKIMGKAPTATPAPATQTKPTVQPTPTAQPAAPAPSSEYPNMPAEIAGLADDDPLKISWKALEDIKKSPKSAIRIAKVKHMDGSWYLYSKDGKKKLGGPYKTRGEALKRMRQVEFFKHKKGIEDLKSMKYKAVFRKHPEFKSKSAWIIYEDNIPAMTVNAEQAFGESKLAKNELVEKWAFFSSPEYGQLLEKTCGAKGIKQVIAEDFGGFATKTAQVEKLTTRSYNKGQYVRNVPTGKIGKVIDTKGEWYSVNYGDIVDYTMAEMLEEVADNEKQTGHIRELTDTVERPHEYNITDQFMNRIKDLPEAEKRDLQKGDVALADRSKVEAPPVAHMAKTAQVPSPAGDTKVGPPGGQGAALPVQDTTSAPAPGEPAPEAKKEAPQALVTPEAEAKLTGEEYPVAMPISEVLLQMLAPILAASNEWSVAQTLDELKNIFSNQRELDIFQGRLGELVEAVKQRTRPALIPRAMNYMHCVASLNIPKDELVKVLAPIYRFADEEEVQEPLDIEDVSKTHEEAKQDIGKLEKTVSAPETQPRPGDFVQFTNTDRETITAEVIKSTPTSSDIQYKRTSVEDPNQVLTKELHNVPNNIFWTIWSREQLSPTVLAKLQEAIYKPQIVSKQDVTELEQQMRGRSAELEIKINTLTQELSNTTKDMTQTNETLQKENESLKQKVGSLEGKVKLLYKLPRAKRLAQLKLDCYLTDHDETDELLKLSDKDFMIKEHEVKAVQQRLKTKLAQVNVPVNLGSNVITVLPGSLGQSEEKDPIPTSKKNSLGTLDNMWSRPGTTGDINKE